LNGAVGKGPKPVIRMVNGRFLPSARMSQAKTHGDLFDSE
jgi:hypothetical protein